MTTYSFVIVDQDSVAPAVIATVESDTCSIATEVHRDICGELVVLLPQYHMTEVFFGAKLLAVEDFIDNGVSHIQKFLDDVLTENSFTFIITFRDDEFITGVEYRYTIQKAPFQWAPK